MAFTESPKPFEVELLVAEIDDAGAVELYHILYDGSITDEEGHVAIGGSAEAITTKLREVHRDDMTLQEAIKAAHGALIAVEEREIAAERLEVGGLDRTRGRRKFFRLERDAVAAALD